MNQWRTWHQWHQRPWCYRASPALRQSLLIAFGRRRSGRRNGDKRWAGVGKRAWRNAARHQHRVAYRVWDCHGVLLSLKNGSPNGAPLRVGDIMDSVNATRTGCLRRRGFGAYRFRRIWALARRRRFMRTSSHAATETAALSLSGVRSGGISSAFCINRIRRNGGVRMLWHVAWHSNRDRAVERSWLLSVLQHCASLLRCCSIRPFDAFRRERKCAAIRA